MLLVGWLVDLVGQKLGVAILNSFYVVFGLILARIPFHPNRSKNTEVENVHYWSVWLVGLVGQKMVVGISNSFYVVFGPLLAPIPNFIQIRRKTQKLKIFAIGRFWLVGLVGRKMVAAISKIRNLFRGLPIAKFEPNRMKIGGVSPS